MIIGINGKIGSGKDTIGKIIQYLTDDTVSKTVYPKFEEFDKLDVGNEGYHPWQIKKFAGKLKQTASLLTGVPVEMWEDQEFKKQYMSEEWNTDFTEVEDKYAGRMTYREFLQRLGTEAMRDGLHENVWVNALFADYHPTPNKSMDESFMEQFVTGKSEIHYALPNWIITDMRFENEMEDVKQREGITIRVTRPVKKSENTPRLHPSETSLDSAEFDYEIINDGTLEDLVEKVREILVKEKLI